MGNEQGPETQAARFFKKDQISTLASATVMR